MKQWRETQPEDEKPTLRYIDAAGKVRYKGLPSLKKTQSLNFRFFWWFLC